MKPFVAQWIAAMTGNLAMLSGGLHFGWSSPMLPKLLSGEDEMKLTKAEASWVVSLLSVGCVFGPILAKLMVDRIGRKRSLLWISLPFLVSWIIIGFAIDAETLYIGRFVGGIGTGAVFCLVPIYFGEIAEDKIRGALGTLMLTMLNAGMVMSYSIGPWISRQMLSIVSVVPILVFIVTFLIMPETPYYYLLQDREEDAQKSLSWLRQNANVSEELKQMKMMVEKQQHNRGSFAELVKMPGNRKGLIVSMMLLTFQQMSGVTAIQSYASMIFEESGFVISGDESVIIMGVMKLSIGVATFFMIDTLGRRPMLIASATFTAIVLTCEAIFFNLKYASKDTSSVSWLPLFGILIFYITYTIGLANVPFAVIAEVFPMNVKAPAGMILAMYASALGALVAKVYQVVETGFGVHVAFYGFAVITIMCVPFTFFYVPETKGQSLQDIQDNLNRSADDTNDKY